MQDDDIIPQKAFLKAPGACRNVIDTASNYRGGRGQRAVGQAVLALMHSRKVGRDSLFFSTKAGFVDSLAMQELLSKRKISQTDVVAGAHCIHPACLEASLDNSLRDMHLDTVSSNKIRPDSWQRVIPRSRAASQATHQSVAKTILKPCMKLIL